MPGVVAAKCGAHVILSDREGSPQLLQNLRSTCTINGLSEHDVDILAISWGIFSPTLLQLEAPDLILASDCFYNSKGANHDGRSLMISFNMKLQSLFQKKLLDLLNGCVLFLAPEFINIPPLVPTPKHQSNLALFLGCVVNTYVCYKEQGD